MIVENQKTSGSESHHAQTLGDWGEFRLIREVVLPAFSCQKNVSPLGDDCAAVDLPQRDGKLVVTTDVAPKPLAWQVGDKSYRTWGWYAVLVNVSDLASSGCYPLAYTSSVEAPANFFVEDFKEFFGGVSDACRAMGVANAGGNLRQAPSFGCHGTAIGWAKDLNVLGRRGCRPGDFLVSIGELGNFATAYLRATECGWANLDPRDRDYLSRPMPRVREVQKLHSHGVLRGASDNSDGVLGSIINIAELSGCAVELNLDINRVPEKIKEAANHFGYDPWNLMFFWGDWQVIAAVAQERMNEFGVICAEERIPYAVLGRAVQGSPRLIGMQNNEYKSVRLLRNENFVSTSFNSSIKSNVDYMLETPIFE